MAAGITTRGALQAFKDRIQVEDIVIIPANILSTLLENTVNNHEKLVQSHNRIGCALEQLALNLQQMQCRNQGDEFRSLLEKMDILTSTIAESKPLQDLSHTTNAEIEENLCTYMEIEEKLLESRDLACYYEELLRRDTPYAPWKFRTEINPTTPEYEKPILADRTKEKVSNQIRLLQARTQHLNSQLEQLNIEIEAIKSTLPSWKQERLTNRMQANSVRVKVRWSKSMDRIRNNYEQDMNSGETQFMVKIAVNHITGRRSPQRNLQDLHGYKQINTRLNQENY